MKLLEKKKKKPRLYLKLMKYNLWVFNYSLNVVSFRERVMREQQCPNKIAIAEKMREKRG